MAERPIAAEELENINQSIAVGSIDLHHEHDPELHDEVVRTRMIFFGQTLGWDDKNHSLHGAFSALKDIHSTVMPLATLLSTQRFLAGTFGAEETKKIVSRKPAVLGYAPEGLGLKIKLMRALGFHDRNDVKQPEKIKPVFIVPIEAALIASTAPTVKERLSDGAGYMLVASYIKRIMDLKTTAQRK